jgi:hypothetical protein
MLGLPRDKDDDKVRDSRSADGPPNVPFMAASELETTRITPDGSSVSLQGHSGYRPGQ